MLETMQDLWQQEEETARGVARVRPPRAQRVPLRGWSSLRLHPRRHAVPASRVASPADLRASQRPQLQQPQRPCLLTRPPPGWSG